MGYEFFEEKIIFPSAPVPGTNNDQSLIHRNLADGKIGNFALKMQILFK